MRNEQQPVESQCNSPSDGKEYTHPAFGQIRASRVQGQVNLYGSDFQHHAFMEITICRSTLRRSLSHDWHHGGRELISVVLSEAQWATFISSLHCGSGTPCTINHVDCKDMPAIPARNERVVTKMEMDERIAKVTSHLDDAIAGVEANLVGLSKVKRDAILASLRKAQREVSDSMPFAADSFAEHVEATVEKAKIEVEAYVQATITRAGLKAIAGQSPLSLPAVGGES